MIITIILGLIWIGFIGLYYYCEKCYKIECSSITKKEYPQKAIICIGLFLIDRFPGVQQAKTNYSLLQLHGRQEYASRQRYYEAERLSLMVLFIFLTIGIVFILNLKSITVNEVSKVERNHFGEGDQTYHYYYDLNLHEGKKEAYFNDSITFIVPEIMPTQEEIIEELNRIKKVLPDIVLGENQDFNYVDRNLYLPKSLSEEVHIHWTSSNEQFLQNNGQIRYNNLIKEGEEVSLMANIECYGLEETVQYHLKLYKKSLDPNIKKELINSRIKLILSQQSLADNNGTVELPKVFEDYDVTMQWYDGDRRVATIQYLIIGIIISLLFYYLKHHELRMKVNKRQEELLRAFPGFVNKFALLMNAGMTFTKAWDKIASDYIRFKKSSEETILLYEEMLLTLEDLQKGISELKAYEAFGQRCKLPEILRFSAIVIQNIKKGSDLLISAMVQLSKEAMVLREDLARKKGEKASTKLVLPMGIMFIAILIIVITPALITMKM